MPELTINYLAVVVAGAVAFGLGALWYSPALFAKAWQEAQGFSDEQLKEMQQGMGKVYGATFVANLVMAFAIAILVSYLGFTNIVQGLKLGALIWVGFVAATGLIANLYSDKPIKLFYIDAGYQLVYILFMSALISFWR